MTTNELSLVSLLRRKMGDLPTRAVVVGDVGTTIYVNGVPSTAVTGDIGKTTWDSTKQIWSDQELLDELLDALILLFSGDKTILDTIDEVEQRVVVLATRVELTMQLAMDATRYVRYTALSVNADPVSPSELINLAKALKEQLDAVKNELEDDIGSTIVVGTVRIFDKHEQLMLPTEYAPPPRMPKWIVSNVATGINIFIPYTMIIDYSQHYIRKTVSGTTNIFKTYSTLKELTEIDTDVIENEDYVYDLYLETINGDSYSTSVAIKRVTPA